MSSGSSQGRAGHRGAAVAAAIAAALLLAACGSSQTASGTRSSPTAAPGQVGSYKVGTPYQIRGVWYHPVVDYRYNETGIASWYGPGFHGRRTANGERYDQHDLTAAHPTLPMPSLVRVTNLENGRSLKLRINDRGPFSNNRIIDVSQRAAQLLGFERQGTASVRVEVLEEESRQLAAIARGERAPPPAQPAPQVQVASAPVTTVQRETVAPPTPAQAPAQSPAQPPAQTSPPAAAPAAPPPQDRPAVQPDGVVTQQPVEATSLFIQAGSFTEYGNASRLAERLTPHGSVQIEPAAVDGRSFYRVRIGPVASVDQADLLLDRLISDGYLESRVIVQ